MNRMISMPVEDLAVYTCVIFLFGLLLGTALQKFLSAIHVVKRQFVHKKTANVYNVVAVGYIEKDMSPVVVYKSDKTGTVFVRPETEFFDGRFEEI